MDFWKWLLFLLLLTSAFGQTTTTTQSDDDDNGSNVAVGLPVGLGLFVIAVFTVLGVYVINHRDRQSKREAHYNLYNKASYGNNPTAAVHFDKPEQYNMLPTTMNLLGSTADGGGTGGDDGDGLYATQFGQATTQTGLPPVALPLLTSGHDHPITLPPVTYGGFDNLYGCYPSTSAISGFGPFFNDTMLSKKPLWHDSSPLPTKFDFPFDFTNTFGPTTTHPPASSYLLEPMRSALPPVILPSMATTGDGIVTQQQQPQTANPVSATPLIGPNTCGGGSGAGGHNNAADVWAPKRTILDTYVTTTQTFETNVYNNASPDKLGELLQQPYEHHQQTAAASVSTQDSTVADPLPPGPTTIAANTTQPPLQPLQPGTNAVQEERTTPPTYTPHPQQLAPDYSTPKKSPSVVPPVPYYESPDQDPLVPLNMMNTAPSSSNCVSSVTSPTSTIRPLSPSSSICQSPRDSPFPRGESRASPAELMY